MDICNLSESLSLSPHETEHLLRRLRNLLRDPMNEITKKHKMKVRAFLRENPRASTSEALHQLQKEIGMEISKEQLRGLINFAKYKMGKMSVSEEMRLTVRRLVSEFLKHGECRHGEASESSDTHRIHSLTSLYDAIENNTHLPRAQVIGSQNISLTKEHKHVIHEAISKHTGTKSQLMKELSENTSLSSSQLAIYLTKYMAHRKAVPTVSRKLIDQYVRKNLHESPVQLCNQLQHRNLGIPRLQLYMLVHGAVRKAKRRLVTTKDKQFVKQLLDTPAFANISSLKEAEKSESLLQELKSKTGLSTAQLDDLISRIINSRQKRPITARDRLLVQDVVTRTRDSPHHVQQNQLKQIQQETGLNASQMSNLVRQSKRHMAT
eukprot:CAMPEP_0117452310 /NCGR_PEP_ID=MMETSP0759-20121206/9534_1 /TAXON_ID=63605 /ORGANISM="Percolomonas cosmopolitus, Strain WS" /LENGTH=378 /DNA_ID=CAMNT_0005245091 /DNA_START=179 /DNA_END=1312 /DNA_ORIENTATION=-